MLYILLIIIAIGVFLASESGREVLGALHGGLVWLIGWDLFLSFLGVIFWVLSQDSIQSVVNGKTADFLGILILGYFIARNFMSYKAGKKDRSGFLKISILLGVLMLGSISAFFSK